MRRLLLLLFFLVSLSGPLTAGPITGPAGDRRVSLGSFDIRWDAGAEQLTIQARNHSGRAHWASVPGRGFLAAREADIEVEENRGSFDIDETTHTRWTEQFLDDWQTKGARLLLSGRLRSKTGSVLPWTWTFTKMAGGELAFEASVPSSRATVLEATWISDRGERFYGFGEQFTHLNLKGQRVTVLSQEQGVGRGHPIITPIINLLSPGSGGNPLSTYAAAPFYFTNRNRSLFLENTEIAIFDLRHPNRVEAALHANRMKGRLLPGTSPLEFIERYTAWAGRMAPLPDWFHSGAIVGLQGGTARVRSVWKKLRARNTPLAAFWLQDWVGKRKTRVGSQLWWNWKLDGTLYPGWNQLVSDLDARDVRVLGYVNPFLVDVSGRKGVSQNLYAEARAKGYLVEEPSGDPYPIQNTDFDAGLIDLSNPAARTWLKDIIKKNLLGNGFSGWMADFGEALPFDARLFGADPETYHNRYPVEWARLNREAIREAGRESDVVFFCRSAFSKSPGHARLFWEGDQMVTWDRYDGLQSAIRGLLSGGFSGMALNHSDIGGYTSASLFRIGYRRERELLIRWMEANAFTPVFRTHEGLQPEANAQIYDDDRLLDAFTKWARVYAALAFYRKKLFREAEKTGAPVVRHLLLHYPQDPTAHRIQDQFLLGDAFLVAPVVKKRRWWRVVYLPPGQWTHVWSGRTRGGKKRGRWIWSFAPKGRPPVFFKKGHPAGKRFLKNLRAAGIR